MIPSIESRAEDILKCKIVGNLVKKSGSVQNYIINCVYSLRQQSSRMYSFKENFQFALHYFNAKKLKILLKTFQI